MKKIIFSVALLTGIVGMAQNTGIGTTKPNASARLEVSSNNQGFLVPRIALSSTTVAAPINAPAESLLIYNTVTTNDVKPGYYYWSNNKWNRFYDSSNGGNNTVLNGTVAPTTTVGQIGDFYINTSTSQIYGPKTTSGWGSSTSLVGPKGDTGAAGPQGLQGPVGATGAAGKSMLSGSGTPASSLGVTGDTYLDTSTGLVWSKASGAWVNTNQSLRGPQGLQGTQGVAGPAGPVGATGPQGLQGLKGDTGLTGATGPQGPKGDTGAAGPQGLQGPVGATGAAGKSMLSGSGTPASSLGVTGDTYLDTSTGLVWSKASGAWVNTNQSLRGPQGLQGTQGVAGPAGPVGATGPQGIQGLKGDTGLTGATGPQGPAGVVNATNGITYTPATQTVSLPAGTTTGQVLKWNNTAWAPAADANDNTNIYTTNGTLTGARTVTMGANNLMFTGTGNVGIGTSNPTEKLEVSGNAKITGDRLAVRGQDNNDGQFPNITIGSAPVFGNLPAIGINNANFPVKGLFLLILQIILFLIY